MFDFKSLLSDVRNAYKQKNDQIKEIQDQILFLKTSPPPRADLINYFENRVDQLAKGFDTSFAFSVELLMRSPLQMNNVTHIGIITAAGQGQNHSPQSIEAAILAIFADDVKDALRKRLTAMSWPGNTGPSLAQRPALIAQYEKELTTLIAQRDKLRHEAASSGITL
jgi:hypothetical protein